MYVRITGSLLASLLRLPHRCFHHPDSSLTFLPTRPQQEGLLNRRVPLPNQEGHRGRRVWSARSHSSQLGPSWNVASPGVGRDPGRSRRATTRAQVHRAQDDGAEIRSALGVFALIAAASTRLMSSPLNPSFTYTCEIAGFDPYRVGIDEPTFDFTLAALAASSSSNVTITADMGDLRIPKSFRQAKSSPQWEYWKAAIAKELGGLVALNTWDMVLASTMPAGANLMHCHYVFTVKRKKDGSIDKFKARLVADGNTQKFGVDFDRIFAAVVKTTTIRLVLLLAAQRDYNLSSIDITQAYLQADLTGDLFMRLPPDIYPFDSQRRPLVCKLRRSLYGLKQAGREWHSCSRRFS